MEDGIEDGRECAGWERIAALKLQEREKQSVERANSSENER